jgi:hypothetical protein
VTRLRAERPKFDSRQGAENFTLRHRVQTESGVHITFYTTGTGGSFAGDKVGREADHSLLPNFEVKNAWSYTSTSLYVFAVWCLVKYRIHLHGAGPIKYKDNFTFTFILKLPRRMLGWKLYLFFSFKLITMPWRSIGERRYKTTHSLTTTIGGGEWTASRSSRSTPRERAPGTHWTGGWVCP